MCGLAGFSLSEASTVNARELGHNLLKEIQWRGTMASGYAYFDEQGKMGVYKDAVPGSQLPLKGMPRNAKTAIFHTRLTTQGTERNNENNHPVISPNEYIALTHNGVIYNDQEVRFDSLRGVELPEVDTAVIAGVIEFFGLDGIEEIYGDAAIGWLDKRKPHELNLARIESSPVAYTWLMDGSFVYASTPLILQDALDAMKLDYGYTFIMDEKVYYNVTSGVVMDYQRTPDMAEWDWRGGYAYRSQMQKLTSGNHGIGSGFGQFQSGVPSENESTFVNRYDADTDSWEYVEDPEEQASAAFHAALALMNMDDPDDLPQESDLHSYYTIDTDGDFKSYRNLDELETELKWYAGLRKTEDVFGAEGAARWIEHFTDVGAYDMDGDIVSWIDNPEEIWQHEDPNTDGLGFIREGAGILQRFSGA